MGFIAREGGLVRLSATAGETIIFIPLEQMYQVVINFSEVHNLNKSDTEEIRVETEAQLAYKHATHRQYLQDLFESLGLKEGVCVDIGAHDGLNHSNSLALFQQGWKGLSIECDPNRFARLAHVYRMFPKVQLNRNKITPQNVCAVLAGNLIPQDFDFLSLDIDSYDYYVLEALLQKYRPTVICTEINEVIPPPLKFAVHYDPQFALDFSTRFYGQSLSMLAELAERHNYKILNMHRMDVFLIDGHYADGNEDLETLYRKGFLDLPTPTYYQNYPFDVEALQKASPEEGLKLIQEGFAAYAGKFTLSL